MSEQKYYLSISNEAKDRGCLVLQNLVVKVDGVPQRLTRPSGRSSGKTKGDFGPVDKTDSCDAATFVIVRGKDVTKKSNVVEVTDGATTIKMEIPNVLVEWTWATPPPTQSAPGKSISIRVAPAAQRGGGQNDPTNYLVASMDDGTTNAGHSVKLLPRPQGDGSIAVDIPDSVHAGAFTFYLVSDEEAVSVISCGASTCMAASEFVLTAPITIAR